MQPATCSNAFVVRTCGLSQIFSMRYRNRTDCAGNRWLEDTVIPYNEFTGEGTGFSFENYNAHEMKDAVVRAIQVYRQKDKWQSVIKQCMQQDFSWAHSAAEYKELYEQICGITVTK